MSSFGQFIKSVREERKLTLSEVAEKSGISHSHLSRIESGDRNPPKAPVMQKLARALNIPFIQLMDKAGLWENLSQEEKENLQQLYSEDDSNLEKLLELLRVIRTDDGTFPVSLHKDLFEIFGGKINMMSKEQDEFDKFYEYYLTLDEEERTKSEEEEAFNSFNSIYNYKNIKEALIHHTERHFVLYTEFEEFIDDLQNLFKEKKITNSSANAKEFVRDLAELSDTKLFERYSPILDGEELDQEEYLEMIAYARARRLMRQNELHVNDDNRE